jgi:hypothetical protein
MKFAPLFLTIAAIALPAWARAESDKTKHYELKNRSVFHAGEDARIPFWPIGYHRPDKSGSTGTVVAVPASKIQLEPRHFNVTSILLGNPALATINGRSFGEGEVLPVVSGSERLRVVVRRILDGSVTLDFEGNEIHVPMKRPELGQKQAQAQARPSEFVIQVGSPSTK